jgi:hypothetical protein
MGELIIIGVVFYGGSWLAIGMVTLIIEVGTKINQFIKGDKW